VCILMCVYVCACVCVRIYKYIYTYICINIYIHISIHILCVCIYIFMYLHIHIYKLYVYMNLYIYTYIYIHMHILTNQHTHQPSSPPHICLRENQVIVLLVINWLFTHYHHFLCMCTLPKHTSTFLRIVKASMGWLRLVGSLNL